MTDADISTVRIRNDRPLSEVIDQCIKWGGYGYDHVVFADNQLILLANKPVSYTHVPYIFAWYTVERNINRVHQLEDGTTVYIREP
ncbi:hypothetical protein D1872_51340 [compost metagenome]